MSATDDLAPARPSPSCRFQQPDEVAGMVGYIAAYRGPGLNGATL